MTHLITLENWYQIDFKIEGRPKTTLQKISKLVDVLRTSDLIKSWFYLFENTTIRVRFNTFRSEDLKSAIGNSTGVLGLVTVPEKPFEPYAEGDDMFANVEVVETFANIMANLTSLTIKRLADANFSNFRLMERLTHCIFNNIYGSNTEPYIRLKLLGFDFQSQDNPEQTFLDDNQKYALGSSVTITTPPINIPKK